jgi:hypothetical protein
MCTDSMFSSVDDALGRSMDFSQPHTVFHVAEVVSTFSMRVIGNPDAVYLVLYLPGRVLLQIAKTLDIPEYCSSQFSLNLLPRHPDFRARAQLR